MLTYFLLAIYAVFIRISALLIRLIWFKNIFSIHFINENGMSWISPASLEVFFGGVSLRDFSKFLLFYKDASAKKQIFKDISLFAWNTYVNILHYAD